MSEAVLEELDRPGFVRELDALLGVYAAAMKPPAEQLPGRRAIMERHATHPGFRCLVAWGDDGLTGFAYGFHGEAGQWWHDVVRTALTHTLDGRHARRWLKDAFEVGEVHVVPGAQGRGIGRRLVTHLCGRRPERTAVLSTYDTESRARRLYRSLGFADLLVGFRFPGGDVPYAIMGCALPLKPRRRAAGAGRSPASRWTG